MLVIEIHPLFDLKGSMITTMMMMTKYTVVVEGLNVLYLLLFTYAVCVTTAAVFCVCMRVIFSFLSIRILWLRSEARVTGVSLPTSLLPSGSSIFDRLSYFCIHIGSRRGVCLSSFFFVDVDVLVLVAVASLMTLLRVSCAVSLLLSSIYICIYTYRTCIFACDAYSQYVDVRGVLVFLFVVDVVVAFIQGCRFAGALSVCHCCRVVHPLGKYIFFCDVYFA